MDSGLIKRVATLDIRAAPRDALERQYEHKRSFPFFKSLIDSLAGQRMVFAVYVGQTDKFYQTMVDNKMQVRIIFDKKIPQLDSSTSQGLQYVALHCSADRKESMREYEGWKDHIEKVRDVPLTHILQMQGSSL